MQTTPLTSTQQRRLLALLENRFMANMHRHKLMDWERVRDRLKDRPEKLRSLAQMEETGGEPDVVDYDEISGEYIFVDCSTESPTGRRNVCYDQEAQESRKENAPKNNAVGMSDTMGTRLLNEKQYRALQKLEEFDLKTSSWIETPASIRNLGGALFADRRYSTVFIYHNSAPSYYSSRGFRCELRV